MAKVSVIVPVYNGSPFLAKCLNSLCNQNIQDIEIIIINNGSSDGSEIILHQFAIKDNRIKVISLIDNIGVFGARNRGIKEATGTYIAFCDCDDIVPPGSYAAMYSLCEKENLDVVTADYKEIILQSETVKEFIHTRNRNGFYGYMLGGAIWNRLFRRSFLCQNNIFFRSISHGEDTLFLAEIFSNNAITGTLRKIVYHYYVRLDNQISLALQCNQNALEEYCYAEDEILKAVCNKAPIEEIRRYRREKFYYLRARWWSIVNPQEKETCYPLVRDMALNVLEKTEDFWCSMYVSKQTLATLGFGEYISHIDLYNVAQLALQQFQMGGIGFRYIIQYIKAWMQHKLSRRK